MARCPQTRSARCDPRLQEVQESAITIAGIELMHCISFGINEAAEATDFRSVYQTIRTEAGMPGLVRLSTLQPIFRLDSLIGQSPSVKTPADNRLVSKHRGFDQASAVVA